MNEYPTETHKILLFDGVCNLCNTAVNLVIRHDTKDRFRFASLQSKLAQELLKGHKIDVNKTDSIILIDNGQAYIKSSAALRTARYLNACYPLLYIFIVVPRFIRDAVYDYIARNRYRWFGKRNRCMVPTKELKSKFLG